MTFPVSITEFESFLPHRPPAIWIHQVLDAGLDSGSCAVLYSENAPFAKNNSLLESAYLEWIAQSCGYVSAAQFKFGILTQGSLKDAFLAAVKKFEIFDIPQNLKNGDIFEIHVRSTHKMGPVTVVEGKVYFAKDNEKKLLAQASLKLFGITK